MVEPLHQEGRRRDPATGGVQTLTEMLEDVSFDRAEILHYWRYECTPVSATEEIRVDPADGVARTLQELVRVCAGKYSDNEIREYWQGKCTELQEDTSTFRENSKIVVRAIIPDVNQREDSAMDKESATRHLTLDKWLLEVGGSPILHAHSSAFIQQFGDLDAVLDMCAVSADGTSKEDAEERVKKFLDSAGVVKVAHRRLFQLWFRKKGGFSSSPQPHHHQR